MSINPQFDAISKSFTATLISSDLSGVAAEWVEVALDCILKEGFVRNIPVLGTLSAFWKAGIGVRDILFVRKLQAFLTNLGQHPVEKRRAMIDLLAASAAEEDVGEKLLALLERLDSSLKAKILARVFSTYVEGSISADEFWRISFILDKLPMQDIHVIPQWKSLDLNHVESVRKVLFVSVGVGDFCLDASSTGFVWNKRVCAIFTSVLTAQAP